MWKQAPAAMLLALLAVPAFAGSCPSLMQDIDGMLEDDAVVSALGDAELERVRELRAKGGELHEDGSHAQSVEVLNEALAILEEQDGDSGSDGYSY